MNLRGVLIMIDLLYSSDFTQSVADSGTHLNPYIILFTCLSIIFVLLIIILVELINIKKTINSK